MKSNNELVINGFHRQLAEYKLLDKMFRDRYKMDFAEIKKGRVVEKTGYSFQVEDDFCNWELALDGIKTIRAKFNKLAKCI
ncbi:MAG: hypothetical protein Q8N79_08190 [Candidatus Methanoperedens sp.]|nr:hypothetical protein [Candidatus Methanoperedens sp.]